MTSDPARIKIAWWNTRLSPPKGTALQGKDRELALEVILGLLSLDIDLLCLGEVTRVDVEQMAALVGDGYNIIDFSRSPSKSKFHICVIARVGRVLYVEHEFILSTYAASKYKIAVRFTCLIDESFALDLFIVHWASRIYRGEDTADREHFGHSLRGELNGRLRYTKNIIVIGDFNDEPYNKSMTKTLRVSRDHHVARKSRDVFYNPFWKKMTSADGYGKDTKDAEQTGTYFYRSHKLHRWFVLDQILFSPNFIGNSEWHLDESRTGAWRPQALVDAVESPHSAIDHLPVIAEIEKEQASG